MLSLSAVTDEEWLPLEKEDESGTRFCDYWRTIFQACEEGRGITSTKIYCHMFNKLLMTSVGPLIRLTLMTSLLRRKTRLLALTEFPAVSTGVLVAWVRSSSLMRFELSWKEVLFLMGFADSRIFTPRPLTSMTREGLFDHQSHFGLLKLCNCDCKLVTSAICQSLTGTPLRCIHPSQRCISSRQMTDNIFEIETTALAHVGVRSARIRFSF